MSETLILIQAAINLLLLLSISRTKKKAADALLYARAAYQAGKLRGQSGD